MACQTFFSGDISVSWDPNRRPPPPIAIDREGLVLARKPVRAPADQVAPTEQARTTAEQVPTPAGQVAPAK
jgi:hypothetical protein